MGIPSADQIGMMDFDLTPLGERRRRLPLQRKVKQVYTVLRMFRTTARMEYEHSHGVPMSILNAYMHYSVREF